MSDSTSPMYHELLPRVSASITLISLIGNLVLSKSQYPHECDHHAEQHGSRLQSQKG